MNARHGILGVLLFGLVTAAAPLSAAVDEQRASYSLNVFSDVDGVDVFTHYIDYGFDLDGGVWAGVEWVHDVVVIPALDAPPGSDEAVDAITTASRPINSVGDAYEDFIKIRNSLQANATWGGVSGSYYVSSENDYFAQMVAGGYSRDFLDENLNLAAGLAYSWDDIRPSDHLGSAGVPNYRHTLHGNLVATQVLTASTVLRVGVEYNGIRGQQHDPYRNVYVDGSIAAERHPTERSRRDVFLRLSRHLGADSSLRADFRYYRDDWEIASQTWGLKLNQRVSRQVTVRYRYRYYTQLPAYFYRDDYTDTGSVDGLQTGDYRLGDYGSHLFGGEFVVLTDGLVKAVGFLAHAEMVVSYERYFNSNNFTANIIGSSIRISF